MDYIYLVQTLIPVITVTIAAKYIISSLDNEVDTLVALTNYQEEEIVSLRATIDNYEVIKTRSFDEVQSEYDYQSDEDY